MTNTEEKKIHLTINDTEVTVNEGVLIIEAARSVGIRIPHFCWHPGLSTAGVCRLCLVRVEGMAKLQIACSTPVREGMKVIVNTDEIKTAHKWALEFHLVNHPLDCPICDQAGECKLQDYYMEIGAYQSQLSENKVLKQKVLDIGPTLVLDTERCILCSRCVRFENEVSKTNGLGIFERGDRSEIGLFPGRIIDHNYSYNLADICPVGALTAKDFRFRCRVWFLREQRTICPGCAAGCNVTLYIHKKNNEAYRLRPAPNSKVNPFWMCDIGRNMYRHLNAENRLKTPLIAGKNSEWFSAAQQVAKIFAADQSENKKVALVLSPQYTNEEYKSLLDFFNEKMPNQFTVFSLRPQGEDREQFDGILLRGDRNANTRGLEQVLQAEGVITTTIADATALHNAQWKAVVVLAPEIEAGWPNFDAVYYDFCRQTNVIWFGNIQRTESTPAVQLPIRTFAEKVGTLVNHQGLAQQLTCGKSLLDGIKTIQEFFDLVQEAHL